MVEFGIDCDWRHSGDSTWLATAARRSACEPNRATSRWMDGRGSVERVGATGVRGALFRSRHTAVLHPGKLVVGLAARSSAAGAVIHEETRAQSVAAGRVHTDRGVISADTSCRGHRGVHDVAGRSQP
jgi:glycine/D-amino acid oxidase-like deaminating enzyme